MAKKEHIFLHYYYLSILFSCFFLTFQCNLFGNNAVGNSVLIDNQNRIVVGGFVDAGGLGGIDFLLIRYNADGTLDTTFNPNGLQPGIVTTDIGSRRDNINSIVLDNQNRIVAAGSSSDGLTTVIALVRYNEDGSLDTTFNPSGAGSGVPGVVFTSVFGNTDVANDVIIDSSNRILITGRSVRLTNSDVVVIRYNPDGSIDETFNQAGDISAQAGIVVTDIALDANNENSQIDIGNAIAIDSQGRIIVTGSTNNSFTTNFLTIRYNSNGSLDQTFNAQGDQPGFPGVVITNILGQDTAYDIEIGANDSILAVGTASDFNGSDIALIRYLSNGSFDQTFNPSGGTFPQGVVVTSFDPSNAEAFSSAIDSNNRIIVSGFVRSPSTGDAQEGLPPGTTSFLTVRYNQNGSLDETFNQDGTPGFVITTIDNNSSASAAVPNAQSNSVAITTDDAIVSAGFASNGFQNDVAVVQYTQSGVLDQNFNSAGLQPGVVITQVGPEAEGLFPVINELKPIEKASVDPELVSKTSAFKLIKPHINKPSSGFVSKTPEVEISGVSAPKSEIRILSNGQELGSVKTDLKGSWHSTLKLADGRYSLHVVATDKISSLCAGSDPIYIIVDTKKPNPPVILNPTDGQDIDSNTLQIAGKSDPNVNIKIFINRKLYKTVKANEDGDWGKSVSLEDGNYTVNARAVSYTKNLGPFSKSINFSISTKKEKEPEKLIKKPKDEIKATAEKGRKKSKIKESSLDIKSMTKELGLTGGGILQFKGKNKPEREINVLIDGKKIGKTKSNSSGTWILRVDSNSISKGLHNAQVISLKRNNRLDKIATQKLFELT